MKDDIPDEGWMFMYKFDLVTWTRLLSENNIPPTVSARIFTSFRMDNNKIKLKF